MELLAWLAREVSGWDEFAPKPRGEPEPEQVLLGISAAHRAIEDYEWRQAAPQASGWLGADAQRALAEQPQARSPPHACRMCCRAHAPRAAPRGPRMHAPRTPPPRRVQVERRTYEAALALRASLQAGMRRALPPAVLMVLPVLAGAAPRVRSAGAPLDAQAAALAVLSQHFMALVAMAGCPAAVLPVPALDRKGAPWSVLMLGCHNTDALLAKFAAKMGSHIRKTAAVIAEVRHACAPCMRAGGGAGSGAHAARACRSSRRRGRGPRRAPTASSR